MGTLGFEPRSAGISHRRTALLIIAIAHRSMTGASYSSQAVSDEFELTSVYTMSPSIVGI